MDVTEFLGRNQNSLGTLWGGGQGILPFTYAKLWVSLVKDVW